jgi:hypothetical protein
MVYLLIRSLLILMIESVLVLVCMLIYYNNFLRPLKLTLYLKRGIYCGNSNVSARKFSVLIKFI